MKVMKRGKVWERTDEEEKYERKRGRRKSVQGK